MSGEIDLQKLLAGMSATLHPDTFVFTTFPVGTAVPEIPYRMCFHEAEGTTLIVSKQHVDGTNIKFEFPCRMITLNVHSALDAVGFIARVATELANLGMGVNPVAGFYHDHLFIPEDRADDAMTALDAMARAGQSG
ncbi:MAG: ACT domain-containing protein [Pseudomonadota bacterium]